MNTKADTSQSAAPDAFLPNDDAHLQEINQEIYKRNLELAVVNKTLSLLRKLYQISLLTLEPASISEKMSETVRVELNMEVVGVFTFEEKTDSLIPFKFAESERLLAITAKLEFLFHKLKITGLSRKPALKQVIYEKKPALMNNLESIWGGIVEDAKLKIVARESHLKTVLLYPLITEKRTIGALLLGLNRDYGTLNAHEQDSIKSLIDVVAVALDKAFLYEQLQVLNEQLRQLDQARAEFITIASHQLRTPPATLKWYLAAILSGDYGEISAEVKSELEKTQATNNGLIALIDDMLNASRIERGKMEFFFEPTDVAEITEAAVDQLQPIALMKYLALTYNKPVEPLPQIMADREKLRQVINNLIDNAIKYTSKGSVTVTLSQKDDNILVTVTDTGKGIAKNQAGGLFERYNRGRDSVTHAPGLGLGLYVAKIIVDQHKGKIWAESRGENAGATFAFSIPIHNDLSQTTLFDLSQGEAVKIGTAMVKPT